MTVTSSVLVLGAGLVLAAQGSGRTDQSANMTDRERAPMWVPGADVPMAVYIRFEEPPAAPPR
jgi:hypothetical protein